MSNYLGQTLNGLHFFSFVKFSLFCAVDAFSWKTGKRAAFSTITEWILNLLLYRWRRELWSLDYLFSCASETWAFVSVKWGNRNLQGISRWRCDKLERFRFCLLSRIFMFLAYVGVKTNANRTLKINSRQSSSHPTHKAFCHFYVLVVKLLEEALEDVTHFFDLSSACKHSNYDFCRWNSIWNERKSLKAMLHLLEHTAHCQLTLSIHLFSSRNGKRNFL